MIVGVATRHEGWRAELRVEDKAGNILGERELNSSAESCAELDDSVALAIALLIDPEHSLTTLPLAEARIPAPPPSPAPSAPPAIVEAPPSPPSAAPARVVAYSSPPHRSVKASAIAVAGLLPEVALGAQLEFWQPVLGADSLRRHGVQKCRDDSRSVHPKPVGIAARKRACVRRRV